MSGLNATAPDYAGYIYAAILAFGGLMGARKGSIVSFVMGCGSAAIAAYGANRVSYDSKDVTVSLSVAWALSAIMGFRFWRSLKFRPAGLVMVLSVIMGTYYTLQLAVPEEL